MNAEVVATGYGQQVVSCCEVQLRKDIEGWRRIQVGNVEPRMYQQSSIFRYQTNAHETVWELFLALPERC